MIRPETKEAFINELYASIDQIHKPLGEPTEQLWGELWEVMNAPQVLRPMKDAPKDKPILLYWLNSLGYLRFTIAIFFKKFEMECGYEFQGDADYHEESDTSYFPEGWYESMEVGESGDGGDYVLHEDFIGWLPLPVVKLPEAKAKEDDNGKK